MHFIFIPRRIIEDKVLGEYRVLFYTYFALCKGIMPSIGFSIESIMDWAKVPKNAHANGSNAKIREALTDFVKANQGDISNVLPYTNLKAHYSVEFPADFFRSKHGYAMLSYIEIATIIEHLPHYNKGATRKISLADTFTVLTYLRVNTPKRNYAFSGGDNTTNECCFRYYKTIAQDLNIPDYYISRIVGLLADLDIIVCVDGPTRKFPDGNIRTSCKYFADTYRYRKNAAGEYVLDEKYSPYKEIEHQMKKGIKYERF